MKVLGYTRVSAAAPYAGLQLEALASAGVGPQGIFCDVTAGPTGASDRPGFRVLLQCADEGDVIVVWRIDRLGRSLSEVVDSVAMLAARGIAIRSVQDNIDSRTTSGRLMINLLASLAEYDRHLTSERIAAGMSSARRAGKRLGRPPVSGEIVLEKLRLVDDARARGLPASQAAQLAGWSRATYYRHQRHFGTQP